MPISNSLLQIEHVFFIIFSSKNKKVCTTEAMHTELRLLSHKLIGIEILLATLKLVEFAFLPNSYNLSVAKKGYSIPKKENTPKIRLLSLCDKPIITRF